MTRREKRAFIQRSSTKEMWYRLRHNTSAIVGTILFIVIAVSCCASPLFLDYEEDIIKVDAVNKLEGPSLEHLCGTDELGATCSTAYSGAARPRYLWASYLWA